MKGMVFFCGGVDEETEFFDGCDWKRISNYRSGDEVLQLNEDGTATLVPNVKFIHYKDDSPFFLSDNIGSCLTAGHDVVRYSEDGYSRVKMNDIAGDVECMTGSFIPVSCIYDGFLIRKGSDLDFLADALLGSIINPVAMRVCYSLSYNCKKELIKKLFFEENGWSVYARNYPNGRCITNLLLMAGLPYIAVSNIITLINGREDMSYEDFIDNPSKQVLKKYSNGRLAVFYKEDKYGFEVPSHMLVLRRGGRIFVTGDVR